MPQLGDAWRCLTMLLPRLLEAACCLMLIPPESYQPPFDQLLPLGAIHGSAAWNHNRFHSHHSRLKLRGFAALSVPLRSPQRPGIGFPKTSLACTSLRQAPGLDKCRDFLQHLQTSATKGRQILLAS